MENGKNTVKFLIGNGTSGDGNDSIQEHNVFSNSIVTSGRAKYVERIKIPDLRAPKIGYL